MSPSQEELENRVHAITDNLIQKQTLIERLSTEKNSLSLQLERLEVFSLPKTDSQTKPVLKPVLKLNRKPVIRFLNRSFGP